MKLADFTARSVHRENSQLDLTQRTQLSAEVRCKYTAYNVYLMLIPRRWFSGGTKTGVAGEKPSKHALLTLSLGQTWVEILCGVRCALCISITPKPNHETRRRPHGTKVLVSHPPSGRNGG